jgi:hypothetical protein
MSEDGSSAGNCARPRESVIICYKAIPKGPDDALCELEVDDYQLAVQQRTRSPRQLLVQSEAWAALSTRHSVRHIDDCCGSPTTSFSAEISAHNQCLYDSRTIDGAEIPKCSIVQLVIVQLSKSIIG